MLGSILRNGTTVAVLVAGAALMGGCSKQEEAEAQKAPPPEVLVMKVAAQDVPFRKELLGQTKDSGRVDIRARVAGYLLRKHFTEGKPVNEGDVLYEIDPREFAASATEAEARVEQAKAQLGLAESDLERAKQLVATNAMAQRDLDVASARAASARADLRLSEAQLDTARLQLSYTTISAPLKGKAGKSDKDPGSYVDAGSNSYMTEVIATDPITVQFTMSEREGIIFSRDVETSRIALAPGFDRMRIEIDLIDGSRYPQTGDISFQDIKVNPNTGTILLEAKLPNEKDDLAPGQFVKVHLRGIVRKDCIAVPQGAILHTPVGPAVYVVDEEGIARSQPVQLGGWTDNGWVINKGLEEGDKVVLTSFAHVRPSQPVKVTGELTYEEALKRTDLGEDAEGQEAPKEAKKSADAEEKA